MSPSPRPSHWPEGSLLAHRLRQAVLVGYLLAGMTIGPFMPGVSGDRAQIAALAEVSVIFLMFAPVGEFSRKELCVDHPATLHR